MQTHVGMHAYTREISEGIVGLEAQFFYRTKESEFRLALHFRVGQQGHLSGSPCGGPLLRLPCRATHPTPSIAIAVKVFAERSAYIVKK